MLCALLFCAAMVQGAPSPKVEDLAWMSGDWSCETWGGVFEETWSDPKGGTMQGMGRHVAAGKTGMMEFLSLESVEGRVSMFIAVGALSKEARTAERFALVKLGAAVAVFVWSIDDGSPKTITYSRKGPNEMDCVLTGKQDGKDARADFHFSRSH
jgi:hypothetical protein